MSWIEVGLMLLVGHALADYPLQGDFLSKAKNAYSPIAGVPWWQAMGAHSIIHGGFVGVITGIWWLGVAEALCHFMIDENKCAGRLSFNTDQALHIVCKAMWLLIFIFLGGAQ